MARDEEGRTNADTHKMSPEEVKAAGGEGSRRTPGNNPGGVLHQRRIVYSVLYYKKKPEATARDGAKVASGTAEPTDTHPQK